MKRYVSEFRNDVRNIINTSYRMMDTTVELRSESYKAMMKIDEIVGLCDRGGITHIDAVKAICEVYDRWKEGR